VTGGQLTVFLNRAKTRRAVGRPGVGVADAGLGSGRDDDLTVCALTWHRCQMGPMLCHMSGNI